jgi:hypothetical protein
MVKKTNKDYENSNVTVEELPGGENVRINYSRSMSLGFGAFSAQLSYAADFPVGELEDKIPQVVKYVNAKVANEVKTQIDNAPEWVKANRK